MDEQKIIEAFHLMWDHFPEPVMLIKRNRQIYAVNQKAASLGMSDQIKCSSMGEISKAIKAASATGPSTKSARPASSTKARPARPMGIGCP